MQLSINLHCYQHMIIMANPIKETPVLTGKDASAFVKNMNESDRNRVSAHESARIRENFTKVQAITKFQ